MSTTHSVELTADVVVLIVLLNLLSSTQTNIGSFNRIRCTAPAAAAVQIPIHKYPQQGKLAGAQRLRRKFTENLRKFLFLIGKPMESAFGGKVFIVNSG